MAKKRNIRVRGVRREEPDLRKLSRALIALAQAQLEVDAESSHRRPRKSSDRKPVANDQPTKESRP